MLLFVIIAIIRCGQICTSDQVTLVEIYPVMNLTLGTSLVCPDPIDIQNGTINLIPLKNSKEDKNQYWINISAPGITMNFTTITTLPYGFETDPYDRVVIRLIVNGSVSLNVTDILIQTSLEILAVGQDVTFTNSLVGALKFGLFCENLFSEATQIISTKDVCKGRCSCQSYGNCSSFEALGYKSYISLLEFFRQTYQFAHKNEYSRATIIEMAENSDDILSALLELNHTLTIVAKHSINIYDNSLIQGGYIGLYTYALSANHSIISSKDQGCQQGEGVGCGFLDWIIGLRLQCGGTGGSHGGNGGFCTSQSVNYQSTCLQMKSRPIYDSIFDPLLEGSGGGAQNIQDSQVGRGGGVIYIEAYYIVTLYNSTIDSSGAASLSNANYGAGSGGSIQLRTSILLGNNKSMIMANGGDALDTGVGGVGGGGRIRLVFYLLKQEGNITNQLNQNISVMATSGALTKQLKEYEAKYNLSDVQLQGSVATSPCSRGLGLNKDNNCVNCPSGQYQMFFGSTLCRTCLNFDPHAIYQTPSTTAFCQVINCKQGYHMNGSPKTCMTTWSSFEAAIGGRNALFAFIVFLTLLVLSMIIVFIKKQQKMNKTERFASYSNYLLDPDGLLQQIEQSSAKDTFVIEDLPYHVKRLYLSGTNAYNQPWKLYDDTCDQFLLLDQFDNCYKQDLDALFNEFNQKAVYSNWEKGLLIFLRYYYYPFYVFTLTQLQIRKTKILQQLLHKKIDILNTNQSGCFFKFSPSQDFTLAYIDILNYNINVLEWSNMAQFPVSLLLSGQGTFMFPLQINYKDPIIKLLWSQCRLEESDDESRPTLEDFVMKFNYHAKLIDYRQSCNSFIKKFISLVQFTEKFNLQTFNQLQIQVDICIHIVSLKDDKSKIIMVGLKNPKEFEKTAFNVYHLQNFSQHHEIRYSINFDKLKQEQLYDYQIIMDSDPNLNKQIEKYKKYDDNREYINNIRMEYLRKIEEGRGDNEQDALQFDQNIDTFYKYDQRRQRKADESFLYAVKMFLLSTKKILAWCLSQFTRYKTAKIEPRILMALLCIVLLFEWGFAIVYPVILLQEFHSPNREIALNEIIFQMIIFPAAQLFAPMLLSIWLLNSRNIVGKYFLLFNYCGIFSAFIEFIFGITEMLQVASRDNGPPNTYGRYYFINMIKIFQFFVMIVSSYLACVQINYNDRAILLQE